MEKLLPVHEPITSVPESYILPPDIRPGKLEFPLYKDVPVIDLAELSTDRAGVVKKLVKAGEDIGIFYLINHGIPENLIEDMFKTVREFHELPIEDRAKVFSEDKTQMCRYYTSLDYDHEKFHFWRNILLHDECQPAADPLALFPEKPTKFRELASAYVVEQRKLFVTLVDLICEGLGVDGGHWSNVLMERQKLSMNYYPPCPDPSLVLGLPAHIDTNPLTILAEKTEYPGYHIFTNGEWVTLTPPPNGLIINLGYSWEVISNGRIKGDIHRVFVNDKLIRITIASSIHPAAMAIIEPDKLVINETNPSKYEPGRYQNLHRMHKARYCEGKI